MDPMVNDELMTVSEAADRLGVSSATIRRAIDKGQLPGFRILGSTHRRVRRADVERARSQQGQPPTADVTTRDGAEVKNDLGKD